MSCFMELASCGSMGSLLRNSLWLIAVDPHRGGSISLRPFAAAVRQCIQAAYPNPPEPPQDWSREGQLDCDCEFYTAVNEFLPKRDVSSMGIYKTLKGNLLHVES